MYLSVASRPRLTFIQPRRHDQVLRQDALGHIFFLLGRLGVHVRGPDTDFRGEATAREVALMCVRVDVDGCRWLPWLQPGMVCRALPTQKKTHQRDPDRGEHAPSLSGAHGHIERWGSVVWRGEPLQTGPLTQRDEGGRERVGGQIGRRVLRGYQIGGGGGGDCLLLLRHQGSCRCREWGQEEKEEGGCGFAPSNERC